MRSKALKHAGTHRLICRHSLRESASCHTDLRRPCPLLTSPQREPFALQRPPRRSPPAPSVFCVGVSLSSKLFFASSLVTVAVSPEVSSSRNWSANGLFALPFLPPDPEPPSIRIL